MTATITPFPQRERENWQERYYDTATSAIKLGLKLQLERMDAISFAAQVIEYANIDLGGDALLSQMAREYMEGIGK